VSVAAGTEAIDPLCWGRFGSSRFHAPLHPRRLQPTVKSVLMELDAAGAERRTPKRSHDPANPPSTESFKPWEFDLTHGAHSGTREQAIEES
jgi:hypothetical protein